MKKILLILLLILPLFIVSGCKQEYNGKAIVSYTIDKNNQTPDIYDNLPLYSCLHFCLQIVYQTYFL